MKIFKTIKDILILAKQNQEILNNLTINKLKEEKAALQTELDNLKKEHLEVRRLEKSSKKYIACYHQAEHNIIKNPTLFIELEKELVRLLSIFPKENNWIPNNYEKN